MEHIAKALNPIKAVVWGEMAMVCFGIPIIPNSFMLITAEKDFAAAVKDAGFRRTPWTYGLWIPNSSLIRLP
ncbi:hypothetical protein V8E54_008449 [Elaphomyces granulatus]